MGVCMCVRARERVCVREGAILCMCVRERGRERMRKEKKKAPGANAKGRQILSLKKTFYVICNRRVWPHILSMENAFYREHILFVENTFYLKGGRR